jgi:hypothetical protein
VQSDSEVLNFRRDVLSNVISLVCQWRIYACWPVRPSYLAAAAFLCRFIQLPQFLWQAVNIIAAAEEPLLHVPLCATVSLMKSLVRVLTHDDSVNSLGIQWSWAADTLQQLLNCAVAVGLLQALPLGTESKASRLFQIGSSIAGDSSSSSIELAQDMSQDIITCTTSLLCCAEAKLRNTTYNLRERTTDHEEKKLLQEICHDFSQWWQNLRCSCWRPAAC